MLPIDTVQLEASFRGLRQDLDVRGREGWIEEPKVENVAHSWPLDQTITDRKF
jgi:hypothetical protein